MKRMMLALAVVACSSSPLLAQTVDAMTCAEFSKQDKTQQMATIAQVQAFTSQKQSGMQLKSDQIFAQLSTKCQGHDDMMLMDAMK